MIIKKNITKIFYFFLFFHLFLWTLIPSVSNTNLTLDTIEALAWGSNLDWGFNKHPPFSAFLVNLVYFAFKHDGFWKSLDTQKVVIYKAFLGEESAFQMAQQIDSIYYQEDEIIVSLFGIDGEDTLQFINLNYFVNDNREDGIFNNDYTIQYITTEQLNHNLDYHLEIRNVETGNIVKSQTKLISPLEINPGFTDEITFFRNNEYRNFKLKWESSSYARLYKPFLRFYYYEKNIDTGELEFKYIEKSFPQILTSNAQAGLDMEISITGESFYYFIKNTLEENTNLLRINAKELEDGLTDYEFWKGGIDFRFLVGGS